MLEFLKMIEDTTPKMISKKYGRFLKIIEIGIEDKHEQLNEIVLKNK